MALALKTACCGNSLRTVCLLLLYFNLIIHAWGLWSGFRMLMISDMMDFITYFYVFLKVLGCVIFLSVIITIYKEKPSLPLLTAAVWFLLVYVAYSVYFMIVSFGNGSLTEIRNSMIEEKATRLHDKRQRYEFTNWMKSNYSLSMFLTHVFVLLIACVVFELYSAWVCYSYREDLKQRPAHGRPLRYINNDDKETNISAPYPPNVNFTTSQYPSLPAKYPILPSYCRDQPPQYSYSLTQNYPQPYNVA